MNLDFSFIMGDRTPEPEAVEQPKKQQAPELAREKQKEEAERVESLRICQENQSRNARTGQLKAEILQGLKSGEDITTLFLKAVEALSLAVNNPLLYTQARQDVLTIYGEGLRQKKPLEMEIDAARSRLRMLQQAVGEAESAEDRERIQGAITKHKENVERLQRLLASSNMAEEAVPK